MMATRRVFTRSSGPAAAVAAVGLVCVTASPVTAQAPRPLIPDRVTLHPSARTALNAESSC